MIFITKLYFVRWHLAKNLISEAIPKKTESGRLVRSYLLSGDVVPDNVVFGLINEKLASAEVAHQGDDDDIYTVSGKKEPTLFPE